MHFTIISLFNNNSPMSFGVFYLNSILKKNNHKSSLIFHLRTKPKRYIHKLKILLTDEEIDRIIEKLKYLKSDIVGLSVYYTFFHAAIKLTKEIQRRLKIPVIWGGIHPSLAPEDCIQYADLICRGEGEEAILELAEKMQKGSDISQIRNLWIRENNIIIRNDVRPLIQDLDFLPFPDFKDKDCHYICTDGFYNPESSKGAYNIISSRGCIFSCSYCSENRIRKIYGKTFRYRTRSPKNVIEELNQIKKDKTIKVISFHDAIFPFETEWIKKFSYLYKKEVKLPFAIRTHPMLTRKQNIDLLVEAGLYYLDMSIESGSEHIRKEIFRRPVTNSKFIEIQKSLSRYKNLKIVYNLIVDNPFETIKEKEDSLDFLLKLPGSFSLVLYSLTFFPKTDITEMALKEGKITDYHLLWATRPSAPSIILSQKRSKEEKFWISLVFLLFLYHRFQFFPKKTIYFISKNCLLKKHPQLLFIVTYYIYKIANRINISKLIWKFFKMIVKK